MGKQRTDDAAKLPPSEHQQAWQEGDGDFIDFIRSFRDSDQSKYVLTDQARELIRRHVERSLAKELNEFVIGMTLKSDVWNDAVLQEFRRRREGHRRS